MSRKREYLADAGSVELTKNPDAMIGALRKIAGHSEIPATPAQVQEMFLDHRPLRSASSRTHPSIDDRIAALVRFGGGREPIDAGTAGTAPQQTFGRREEPPGPRPCRGAASGRGARDRSGRRGIPRSISAAAERALGLALSASAKASLRLVAQSAVVVYCSLQAGCFRSRHAKENRTC